MKRTIQGISILLCFSLTILLCACSITVNIKDSPFGGDTSFVLGSGDGSLLSSGLNIPDSYTSADYTSTISQETLDAEMALLDDLSLTNEKTAFCFFISSNKSRLFIEHENFMVQNAYVYIPTDPETGENTSIIIGYYYIRNSAICSAKLHEFTDQKEAYAYFRRNGWMDEKGTATILTAAECFTDEVKADALKHDLMDEANDFAARVRAGQIQPLNF